MSIKSRPVYAGFDLGKLANRNLFILKGDGAYALLEKLDKKHPMLAKIEILHCEDGTNHTEALNTLGVADYWLAASSQALLGRLATTLNTATMSTRLFVAGLEDFIGDVVCLAANYGVKNESVIKEHRGSLKRRVQCVHCKGFNQDVSHSPFRCKHCNLFLFVRDHFSARLNAFQGVCVNAEDPQVLPEPVELFP